MGLQFMNGEDGTVMYDSVTMWAFGPVFDNEEEAQAFCDWAETKGIRDGDVRSVPGTGLWALYGEYVRETMRHA